MKYYKHTNNGVTYYEARETEITVSNNCIEILKEDYETAVESIQTKIEAEAQAAEQSKNDRIAELEAENAALLYQLMTGEELTDV